MKKKLIVLLILFCNVCNVFSQIDSKKKYEDSKKFTERKEFDKALLAINEALTTDSVSRAYLLQKVKILYLSSDCTNAFIILGKLMEYEKKIDDEIISYLCDIADCINESKSATEILIKYVEKKKYNSSEILARLAQRLYLAKDYDNSIHYYKEYIRLNPKDIDAIIDLSKILYSLKRMEDLKNITIQGLKDNENNIRLLNNLASYYFVEKDYKSGIEIENQIIKIQYNVENLASRAMFYEYNKQLSEAYEDYKKIIELDKCNAFHYSKILQYEYNNRMYEKLVENSYKVINCNSSSENSLLDGLYTALFFSGDFEKGSEYLDKKLALNPENINPYYIKSLILLKNKQYDDVLKYLDLALKCKDVDKEDIIRINLLKFGYYLLKEDYEGFVSNWKSGNVKTLDNNLNFTFVKNSESKKTEIKVDFNKNTGIIDTSIIIPTKVFSLLKSKYELTITSSSCPKSSLKNESP